MELPHRCLFNQAWLITAIGSTLSRRTIFAKQLPPTTEFLSLPFMSGTQVSDLIARLCGLMPTYAFAQLATCLPSTTAATRTQALNHWVTRKLLLRPSTHGASTAHRLALDFMLPISSSKGVSTHLAETSSISESTTASRDRLASLVPSASSCLAFQSTPVTAEVKAPPRAGLLSKSLPFVPLTFDIHTDIVSPGQLLLQDNVKSCIRFGLVK